MLVAFGTDGAHSLGSAPVVPVVGDVDADGAQDLVVGQGSDGIRVISDRLAVYRVRSGRAPELLEEIAAFPRASSGSGNLAVADVDPAVAGEEILVGEDGSYRRASVINVFGGLADGRLRLLHSLRAVASQLAEHRSLTFVTGELAPELGGREIAVAQPNGYVSVHTLSTEGGLRLHRFHPFADQLEIGTTTLAIGDVLPHRPGNEIVAAVAGRRDTGLVRILDGLTGSPLAEITPFTAGTLRTSVSLWVADVIDTLPGAELLIGQGTDGGAVGVYNLANGSRPLFNLPDTPYRATSLSRFLAIGDLIPNLGGLELAIAQPDATVPVRVYHLTAQGAKHVSTVSASGMGTISAITASALP